MKKTVSILLTLICLLGGIFIFSSCKETKKIGSRYEIIAEYVPDNGTLTGTAKITYENCTDNEISLLKFQLYPNAYRKDALYAPVSKALQSSAYYAGENYGEMVISSVNGAKNWEVMGEDENILYAYLPHSLYPNDKIVLDIGFMVKLAKVNHRTGITQNTVNLGNFYPTLCGEKRGGFYECAYYADGDPFYQEVADFQLTLKLPKDYAVATTGEIIGERTLESKKEYTVSAAKVRDFALVLSKKFKVLTTQLGEKTLSYYYYADKNAEESFTAAVESFEYFQNTFGEYPYSTYTLVETGFCQGGMEYPCLSMISDALQEEDRIRAIVHETAHQWWNVVVGSDQLENAWQDEGLAEYSACLFFEAYEKYEKYGLNREPLVQEALKEYRSYYDVYGSVLGRTDTRMRRHLSEYVSDFEYKCLAYHKPVVMFDTLRKSVGEEKFEAGLRRYYKDNAFTLATPENLIGSFEKAGLDVSGFFESFLSGEAVL